MLKIVTVFLRRPDLSRAAFRSYYEGHHVPLALTHARDFGFLKYVRNFITGSLGDPPGFDCLTEFWFESPDAAAASMGFMSTAEGKALADDELNFLDMSFHPSLAVEERLIAGPARGIDGRHTTKTAIAMKRAGGIAADAFPSAVEAFGRTLADAHTGSLHRLTLDLVLPGGPTPPFDAILTAWPLEGTILPASFIASPEIAAWCSVLTLDSTEEPPGVLGLRPSRH